MEVHDRPRPPPDRWPTRRVPPEDRPTGLSPRRQAVALVARRVSCLTCGTTLDTFAAREGPVEILCFTCGTFRDAAPAP